MYCVLNSGVLYIKNYLGSKIAAILCHHVIESIKLYRSRVKFEA